MTDNTLKTPVYPDPLILFQTASVTDSSNNSFQTMELVRKGQPLVRLPAPSETPPTNQTELLHGKHTLLSTDKNTLLADIDGYPLLLKETGSKGDRILVEIVPLVSISDDKMRAGITLYPPVSACPELTGELLFEILTDHGIRFDLSLEHLNSMLTRCREKNAPLKDITVARGLLPLNGKDSFLRFAIEVGPLPGKLLGNGKIDFRERKMFVAVAKGQTIATRISATEGTPGFTIYGDEVPQVPGKDIPVTVTGDAEYDEKSGIIRPLHGGVLSMVSENSIKVCAKHTIPGNIDYSTGNIESHGAVEIGGTILPGFKVNIHGDLLLKGNARSATINCQGNLVIKGGIMGEQCKVTVAGDADFSFMEQGRLRVKGKVIIRKQAYHVRIMADGEIHCEASSQIMSGVLMSGKSLDLGNVGSSHSPAALLAAGVAPGRYLRYLSMRSQLRELEHERLLFLQRFGLKKNTLLRKSLEKSIYTLYQDMTKLNLVPESSGDTEDAGETYLRGITITVQGTIFSGTEIQIGNVTKILEQDSTAVCFSLDKNKNKILERSLREE
ncbi:MAG: DUF342 domain-containing protein [Desulfocapsa sp.]|nr:DUF342 domain-containing protein [Desulfocapsa sp.]